LCSESNALAKVAMQFGKTLVGIEKNGNGLVHLRAALADKLFSQNSQLKVKTKKKPEQYLCCSPTMNPSVEKGYWKVIQ
jgi:hypothetical protein